MINNTTASQTVKVASSDYKKAVREVRTIPHCVKTGPGGYFETPLFYIRVLDNEEYVQIQLAERKTFDRWANSVNFVAERTKSPKCYFPLFEPQYKWAIKVLKHRLFNFNRYFAHIELPWFETRRKR